MAKQIFYHQDGKPPTVYTVLKENKDKTVDVGVEGEAPVVTNLPIVDIAKPGFATVPTQAQLKQIADEKAGK